MSTPTTRRHPRTLAEAFPDERAPAIERPDPRGFDPVPWAALAALVAVAVMAWKGWL